MGWRAKRSAKAWPAKEERRRSGRGGERGGELFESDMMARNEVEMGRRRRREREATTAGGGVVQIDGR